MKLLVLCIALFAYRVSARTDVCELDRNVITNAGGQQAYAQESPYMGITTLIAMQGLFPSRNLLLERESNSTSEIDLLQGEPFLAEIKWFGGNFAYRGWAETDGQILPINQNQALFSLLGTTYGGDGRTSFALPDVRSRFILGQGEGSGLSDRPLGQRGGAETTTLTASQMWSHTHTVSATNLGGCSDSSVSGVTCGALAVGTTPTLANTGGNQAVSNMDPYISINYIIALQGTFPSRSVLLEADNSTEPGPYTLLGGSDPILAEVMGFASNFAPRGWAFCAGQLLPIAQNTALFSLLGTIYGGDGRTTFALPDLQGRIPVGTGRGPGLSDFSIGQRGGSETYNTPNVPSHSHTWQARGDASSVCDDFSCTASTSNAGGSTTVYLRPPYLAINIVINLVGIYPSRSVLLGLQNEKDPDALTEQLFQIGDGFIGEISIFASNFAPRGTSLCQGQLLAVSSNSALFSILGTTFGGDGRSTFGLPDLRGRSMMGEGHGPGLSERRLGARGGGEQVTLNTNDMPTHSHSVPTPPTPPIPPAISCTGIITCNGGTGLPSPCCTTTTKCGAGEGDCSNNNVCQSPAMCGRNNCPPPFSGSADCCA